MANVPYAFASAIGRVDASELDANNQFLLDLIENLDGQDVAFDDTIGLGESTLQGAIVALFNLIQSGGGGGSSPSLDLSKSSNSQFDQIAQGE